MRTHPFLHLNIGGQLLPLDSPVVMAILNVTPDSFFSGSRLDGAEAVRLRAEEALRQGASILDVGGYSSRPGAADVPEAEELRRVSEALETIRNGFGDVPVSIDTFRSRVAEEAVQRFGPCIINDITAGEGDPRMAETAARYDLPYVIMHMRCTPDTMQQHCDYRDVTEEVLDYFARRIDELHRQGVYNLILDPGFGFAKTAAQNFELLAGLHRFQVFELPVLAGISRKSMIYRTLGVSPQEALNGTTALHAECLRQGAHILRVHDVTEAAEVIELHKNLAPWTSSI